MQEPVSPMNIEVLFNSAKLIVTLLSILIAVFFFFVYRKRRQDSEYLYFSLTSMALAAVSVYYSGFFQYFFPSTTFWYFYSGIFLILTAFFSNSIVITLYIYSKKRFTWINQAVAVTLFLILLFGKGYFLNVFYFFCAAVYLPFNITIGLREFYRRNREAVYVFLTLLVPFLILLTNDYLLTLGVIEKSLHFNAYALLLYLLGLAMLLADRFVKAQAMDKMKLEFLSNVAHEIKTPITSMRMFAELLQNSPDIEIGKRKQYIDTINTEIGRLLEMVDRTMSLANLRSGKLALNTKPVDTRAILLATVEKFSPVLEKNGFVLDTDIADKVSPIMADQTYLSRVFSNMLSNSIKYSKKEKKLYIKLADYSSEVGFTIRDWGLGIERENRRKIFERGFRGDHDGIAGEGIGLAIVKDIVDLHHGRIVVNQQIEKGSEFTIFFPVIEKQRGI